MHKMSVNGLVDQVTSNLPREFLVSIAQNCLSKSLSNKETVSIFKKEVFNYSLKIQKKVINCTGTLLHTNLGRAHTNIEFNGESSNIEYDILENKRGERNEFLNKSMKLLLDSEDVCFVNNNASSLFITLKTLKDNFDIKSVIISRGEIIEIGGSYRLPEIIKETDLKMVEVGTTNKTNLKDYKKALKENENALVLKVHRSNFSITGFVEDVNLKDLKTLTEEVNSILIHDLGSGLVASRKFMGRENINIFNDEPTVQESLKEGVDIVMFSGDKLFGSVQSGIIAGNKKIIESIKKASLFRTYRCSPLTLFELQETTKKYISKKELEIPLWKMIAINYEDLENRVLSISKKLKIKHEIVEEFSVMGGGTLPNKLIPSPVIRIKESDHKDLINKLMKYETPIIPRINKDNIVIDLRSTIEKNDKFIEDFFSEL